MMLTALTPISKTVLHRCNHSLALHCAVPKLHPPSLCAFYTSSPLRNTLIRRDTTVHLLLFAELICCLLHF